PLTWVAGPIISYNLLILAIPVVNSLATAVLFRRFLHRLSAFIAAGGVGFSSYVIAQLGGHPNLAMAITPPLTAVAILALLGLGSRERGTGDPERGRGDAEHGAGAGPRRRGRGGGRRFPASPGAVARPACAADRSRFRSAARLPVLHLPRSAGGNVPRRPVLPHLPRRVRAQVADRARVGEARLRL